MSENVHVLRPEIEPVVDTPAPEKPIPEAADVSARRHYGEAVKALLLDAQERGMMHCLVDVLARALGFVGFNYGPEVMGEILHALGRNLQHFVQERRAELEAENLKQNGVKPH